VRFNSLAWRFIGVLLAVMLITAAIPAFLVLRSAEEQLRNPNQQQLEVRQAIRQIALLCQRPDQYPELPCLVLQKNLPLKDLLANDFTAKDIPDPFNQRQWVEPALRLGVGIAVLLAVSIALFFTWRITIPVRAVSRAAQKIAQGDLSARAILSRPASANGDELSSLAFAFNYMAAQLEQNQSERKQLIADIAHELRTPITVMQFRLDALEDGIYPLNLEEVQNLSQQNKFLARLVEDLRILTLADTKRLPLERVETDLKALIEAVARQFKPRLGTKKLLLELVPIGIHADPDRMRQVLSNLIENAQKYARETIVVRLESRDQNAVLTVQDDGQGIPESDLNRIFDRFYRVDESRTRATGGSGLGLAIVKAIVLAHDYQIRALNAPNGGAVFEIQLTKPLH
jgi:two-component system, OmpR family, sensor histidine kinase BaeS